MAFLYVLLLIPETKVSFSCYHYVTVFSCHLFAGPESGKYGGYILQAVAGEGGHSLLSQVLVVLANGIYT